MTAFFTNLDDDKYYKEYLEQKRKEEEECRSKGHCTRVEVFCSRCGEPLPKEEKEEQQKHHEDKVARDLIEDDLNHLIVKMLEQGKIDIAAMLEIYHEMKELARARGFLKLPWE